MSEDTIYFYGYGDPEPYMSNFSNHPIVIAGVIYPTTEHYFQAMKTIVPEEREAVRLSNGPGDAKRMGNFKITLRPDWEGIKDFIMMTAVWAKFTQHEDIKEKLLATGSKVLVEHSPSDAYWGDGYKNGGTGQNMLGHILMMVRSELGKVPLK